MAWRHWRRYLAYAILIVVIGGIAVGFLTAVAQGFADLSRNDVVWALGFMVMVIAFVWALVEVT